MITDNGTEFSDSRAIEIEHETGEFICKVFFCHPYCSFEKPHCEKKHEYIRKGTNFDFMVFSYGTEVLDLLQIKKIDFKM